MHKQMGEFFGSTALQLLSCSSDPTSAHSWRCTRLKMFRVCPGRRISLSFPPLFLGSSVVVAFVAGSAHLHLLCCRCRLLTFFGFADDTARLPFCAPNALQKNMLLNIVFRKKLHS